MGLNNSDNNDGGGDDNNNDNQIDLACNKNEAEERVRRSILIGLKGEKIQISMSVCLRDGCCPWGQDCILLNPQINLMYLIAIGEVVGV